MDALAVEGNVTLRLIMLSAYLFIGEEGEPRVGSGCDNLQRFRYKCWNGAPGDHPVCQFYTCVGGQTCSSRRYLGLRLADGFLDTIAVRSAEAQNALTSLSERHSVYRNFQTNFTLTPLSNSKCDSAKVACYGLSTGNHSLNIRKRGSGTLANLHKRAVKGANSETCLVNPGPFQQRYGSGILPSPVFITFNKAFGVGRFRCPHRPFTSKTCAFGRLKATYPVFQEQV